MNKQNNIFLIGFMGSGKSTLGKKLANKLNITFFDLDTEIEKTENKTVAQLFEEKGEDSFRKLEKETLARIINKNENFVLSLGGGTPCFHKNMEVINESGISVYLKYNAGILTSRLINGKKERPLIKGLTENELSVFVEEKLNEREIYYNKSKVIIEGDNVKVDDVIRLIQ